MRKLKLAAIAAASLTVAQMAGANPAVSVNFVNNDNGGVQDGNAESLLSNEVAGAPGYEQSNWNNLGRWGQTTALKDNTGTATAMTTTWDSNNTWNSGAGTATPNAKLMHGYIDSLGLPNQDSPFQFFGNVTVPPATSPTNDNRPIAWVQNINSWLATTGATKYSVILYADGDGVDNRKAEYWLQQANTGDPPTLLGADLTPHVFVNDNANFSGTFTQVPFSSDSVANAVAGNYIVFSGLSADSFLLRSEEQAFRAEFNGFQIVAEVPEPATLGLMGILGAGLLSRRRRQA